MVKNTWLEPLVWWAYSAIAVTGMCALIALSVHQSYRQDANDPQIQMAEDAAAAISSGEQIDQVVPTSKVDINISLSPWIEVFNNAGVPLLSQAVLNNETPMLPQGVFDTTQWNALILGHHFNSSPANENRFTWQPEPSVRQAVVLVHFNSPNGIGYVAAGRSLREVEERELSLIFEAALLWAFTLFCLLIGSYMAWWLLRK